MKNIIWDLFYHTGDVEAYLLLKQIESEQLEEILNVRLDETDVVASIHSKI